jgi:hypothetical protein
LAQVFWLIPMIKSWSKLWYYFAIGGTAILWYCGYCSTTVK